MCHWTGLLFVHCVMQLAVIRHITIRPTKHHTIVIFPVYIKSISNKKVWRHYHLKFIHFQSYTRALQSYASLRVSMCKLTQIPWTSRFRPGMFIHFFAIFILYSQVLYGEQREYIKTKWDAKYTKKCRNHMFVEKFIM